MSATALDFMRAIRDADDAALAKSIAWALVLRANERWLAWPDYDTLAHDIGSSRATVARTMPPLLAAGGVGRVRITMTRQRNGRRWGPTVYQLSLSTSQDEHLRMSISPSDAHHEHLKTGPFKVSNEPPSRSQDETGSAQLTAQGTAQERESTASAALPSHDEYVLTVPEPAKAKPRKPSQPRAPSKPRRAPATAYPADFAPSQGNYELGETLGFDRARVDAMVGEMRDYHVGKGNTWADWHAVMNTWLRNARKFEERDAASRPARVDSRQPAPEGRTWGRRPVQPGGFKRNPYVPEEDPSC